MFINFQQVDFDFFFQFHYKLFSVLPQGADFYATPSGLPTEADMPENLTEEIYYYFRNFIFCPTLNSAIIV